MKAGLAVLFVAAACVGCSKPSSGPGAPTSGTDAVDVASALPGSWKCDDGIGVALKAGGKYEWSVPAGARNVQFGEASSEQHRQNPDGSYVLLGDWRFKDGSLELDMMGDTDRYAVTMSSASALALRGDDQSFSCTKA